VSADGGKGAEISELGTTTELTGLDKGAAISAAASGGKSRAGQQGRTAGLSIRRGRAGRDAEQRRHRDGRHSQRRS
jgi:hypothetical protein